MSEDLHHVIIVGGGAGGLELATKLGNKLGKKGKAKITLVDCELTHVWKPLLHELAAGTLNTYEDEVSYPALAYKNHFIYRIGRMDTLNREKKQISLAPTLDKNGIAYIPRRTYTYDTLIFAVGSQTNDFDIPGVKQHCMFIDTPAEADAFHHALLRNAYTAHAQNEPLREGQLKVAIAGAGATGVELSAELHEAFNQLIKFGIDQLHRENIKITIIEAADRVLPALPPELSEKTLHALNKIDIEVLTGHRIIEATHQGYITDKGGLVPSEIKVWSAGIKAPDFLANIDDLETSSNNRLVVKPTLETTRDSNIFAFGDCAACPLNDTDMTVPPRAQAAHQQASMLFKTIKHRLNGKPLPNYRYLDYGSLINLSNHATVGNMMGNLMGKAAGSFMIEGLLARFMYLSLYKMHQLAIMGLIRVGLISLANMLTQKTRPRMKFH